MESYVGLLLAILVVLIAGFVYFFCALSNLDDKVQRIYMNSSSEYTVRTARDEIITEMNDQIDKVMTEIACVATKSNADIQRVREEYKPGDVVEYNGKKALIVKHVINTSGRITYYHIYYLEEGELFSEERNVLEKNSKLLRHVDLSLG